MFEQATASKEPAIESGEEGQHAVPAHYRMLGIDEQPASKFLSIVYAAVISVVLLALDSCNFAGVSTAVTQQNNKIVQRFLSLFYDNEQRDSLVALLYTDAAATLDRGGWPMQMTDLADLLEDLATSHTIECSEENAPPDCSKIVKAEGIFANIEIRSADHDPDGFCELIQSIHELNKVTDKISLDPINCLANLSRSDSLDGRESWLADWKRRAGRRFVSLDSIPANATPAYFADRTLEEMRDLRRCKHTPILMGAPLVYLNAQRDYINACYPEKSGACQGKTQAFLNEVKNWPGIAWLDLVTILVPLDVSAEQGRSVHLAVDDHLHASPPWLIAKYLDQLSTDTEKCEENSSSEERSANHGERQTNPKFNMPLENLYTVWGRTSLKKQLDTDYNLCSSTSKTERSAISWVRHIQREVIDTLFPPQHADDLIHKCPYHAVVDVADIDTDALTYSDFKEFTNSFVFFGLSMQRFSDSVDTPLYGELPGIFHLMMATDNLLTQGEDFYRANNPLELSKSSPVIGWDDLFQFLFVCVFVYLLSRCHAQICEFIDRNAYLFTQLFLCIAVPLGAWITYAWEWRRWEEISWFGGLVASLSLLFIIGIVSCWLTIGRNKQFYTKSNLHSNTLTWLQYRYSGVVFLAPHCVILSALFLLSVGCAALTAAVLHKPPPNTLALYVSMVPVYLLFHGDELSAGIARLLRSKRVAAKLL